MLLFHDRLFGVLDCQQVGFWLMLAAAVLTVWSMFYYLQIAWPYLSGNGKMPAD